MHNSSWWHPPDRARTAALLAHVWSEVKRTDCLTAAGMLTYATLLSLVPLLTVVISMVAALPGAGDWSGQLQAFMFDNFVPAARETIASKLEELTTNTRGLTAAMGLFLVVTSLILMHNIETTINRIFGVQASRGLVNRFMVYWSTLTLGPILVGASLAISSYFFSLELFADVQAVGVFMRLAKSLTPAMVSALGFLFLFTAVPNRRIRLRQALIGAVLTAIMFELAKKGFGLYVSSFDGYTRLYGALAAFPIFLIWIYLSWSVILVGAAFTAALGSFRDQRIGGWPDRELFVLAYRVMVRFHDAQLEGRSLDEIRLQELEPDAEPDQLQFVIEGLREARIVRRDENGEWVLTRDVEALSLGDIYQTQCYAWPERWSVGVAEDQPGHALKAALESAKSASRSVLDRSLADYLDDERKRIEDKNP